MLLKRLEKFWRSHNFEVSNKMHFNYFQIYKICYYYLKKNPWPLHVKNKYWLPQCDINSVFYFKNNWSNLTLIYSKWIIMSLYIHPNYSITFLYKKSKTVDLTKKNLFSTYIGIYFYYLCAYVLLRSSDKCCRRGKK